MLRLGDIFYLSHKLTFRNNTRVTVKEKWGGYSQEYKVTCENYILEKMLPHL